MRCPTNACTSLLFAQQLEDKVRIPSKSPLFSSLCSPDQLEPRQHSADLCLRGQDRETLGCRRRYGCDYLPNGHGRKRPAAGLLVAEGPPPQHFSVRIHQLSGQEQPWPTHTHHQGQNVPDVAGCSLNISVTSLNVFLFFLLNNT